MAATDVAKTISVREERKERKEMNTTADERR
jgi:hypothetical protein